MKKIKEMGYDLLFFCLGWPLGAAIATLLRLVRVAGIIEVKNYENVLAALKMRKEKKGGMLILSNHPLWVEVFVVPAIVGFPRVLLRPFRYFPWSTPKDSLLKSWFLKWIYLLRALPVPRGRSHAMLQFLKEAAYRLHVKKDMLMTLPEGGRTGSVPGDIIHDEETGRDLRSIKEGYLRILTDKELCPTADPEKVTGLTAWVQVRTEDWFPKLTVHLDVPVKEMN